jgi:hypothetical protein
MEQILEAGVETTTFPATFTFTEEMDMPSLLAWYHNNQKMIEDAMLEKGAILIKGANINTVSKFEAFTGGIDGRYPPIRMHLHSAILHPQQHLVRRLLTVV